MRTHELARKNSTGAEWDWGALRNRCLREARRAGLSGDDAEDAAQQGVMRAWRCREQCARRDQPEPWVAMIGRREALRLLTNRSHEHHQHEHQFEAAALLPDPAEALSVRQALLKLSAQDRVLLALRYHADLRQAEIAELLDTPAGTVAVRLHRARHRLRGLLTA